ncbi:L-2-hydroxyglutarate oxidase [Candidatus Fermentibacteria bacterium]|nr:L-2-hydroxyglutarate oxidase [Candidatus Fermentibacteria bacterium]
MTRYTVAVVGGGIVGAATAMSLLDPPGSTVILLEAEDRLAAHQTGNNSGVIHSGLYYRPGSLKAANCVKGRERLYRFCREYGVPHERCGKIVVATRQDELLRLDELFRRGTANGLTGIRRIGPDEIPAYEPHAAGIAALVVPDTGIVDYAAVTEAMAARIRGAGGEIRLSSRVIGCRREGTELVLETGSGIIRCMNLINCAGLQSDRLSRICGVEPGVAIIPFRGEYYTLLPHRAHLVGNLIYPVPDPRFPFLGVHFTRMIGGGVEAGPNAVLALKREGYRRTDVSLRDCLGFVRFPGFWRMGLRHWRMGLGEGYRSLSKRAFVQALRRLVPDLTAADVAPGGAGVRAQALAPDGALLDDFKIVQAPRMIHVLNAPSPAATAALAIGDSLARIAREQFDV